MGNCCPQYTCTKHATSPSQPLAAQSPPACTLGCLRCLSRDACPEGCLSPAESSLLWGPVPSRDTMLERGNVNSALPDFSCVVPLLGRGIFKMCSMRLSFVFPPSPPYRAPGRRTPGRTAGGSRRSGSGPGGLGGGAARPSSGLVRAAAAGVVGWGFSEGSHKKMVAALPLSLIVSASCFWGIGIGFLPKRSDSPSRCMLGLEHISTFFFPLCGLFILFWFLKSFGPQANNNKYRGNKLRYYTSQQE